MKNIPDYMIRFSRISRAAIFCLFSMLAFIQSGYGQDEKFTASTSASTVGNGEQFQVTFTLNTQGRGFKAPSFSNFNVLMGPNQSSSVQFINGSMSQQLSFTYILQAVKEGTFKIDGAEISVGSKKLVSNSLTINVTKGSGNSASGGTSGQRQGQQGGNSGASQGTIEGGGKNVFIRASADRNSVYQGEGIAVTYRLYTKVDLLNYSISKMPSWNGFWSQDVSLPQQLEFHTENYDGVNYRVADIRKVILFPQHSGNLTIDPIEGEVIARVQVKRQSNSNDPFDQFFNNPFSNPFFGNYRDVKVELKSDPIKVNVKELPANAPQSFSGAVGKLSCEVSLDKKEVKAHDAVSLKIKISGKGNIKLIESPKVTSPPDFESYDPKENANVNPTMAGVTGTKTFEYLLIPRNPGEFKIGVAPFSYFDLDKKQYIEIPVPDLSIKVLKGEGGSATVVSGVERSDVQLLGKDIRFLKTNVPDFNGRKGIFYGGVIFWLLLVIPIVLFLFFLLFRRRAKERAGNVGMIRSQKANKVAMKRLSTAKKFLSANEKDKFLDEMFRAMWGFISDKLQIPVAELSKDSVSASLASRNVSEDLIRQFISTLDDCEFARFAGSAGDNNESIYQKGIDIISKLENAIRS